ncbi:Putative RxLR effector [Phytophthora palmivora]|uniref:RxLR effector n=1 Tax=Phytophthora palmivora TaxID=4796 RepID=A0A2P4YIJ3_9STRA|nr:Putative RxLR effector [Phytophthora palmivora]
MRLHRITLLTVGSLWGVLTATCCNSHTSLLTTGPCDITRFLRLHNDRTKGSAKDDEDRSVSTTAVESISNSLKGEPNQLNI